MDEQALLKEFAGKLRTAAGENLVCLILYGSAADGESHPHSDLNLLCLLRDASFAALSNLAPALDWWHKEHRNPPLIMTAEEMKASADVFSIEFTDMKQRYRVLYGEDLLRGLDVPMRLHAIQLEYELREKLLLLRQHLLLAGGDEKKLWEVMLRSLSSFTTLFRHVLIELGDHARKHSRETVVELSKRLNFNTSAFLQLLEVRTRDADRRDLRANRVAAQYIEAIEQVAAAVDKMHNQAH